MKSRFSSSDRFAGLLITIVVVLLSGSLPFKADSMPGLMVKTANQEAAAVTTIGADIPQAHAAVINKAMVRDAELRYQSSTEFAEALKVLLEA
jgi:serine/threonine-protein kinase